MPQCNMQLVDSQYSVVWKKVWLVSVVVFCLPVCLRTLTEPSFACSASLRMLCCLLWF